AAARCRGGSVLLLAGLAAEQRRDLARRPARVGGVKPFLRLRRSGLGTVGCRFVGTRKERVGLGAARGSAAAASLAVPVGGRIAAHRTIPASAALARRLVAPDGATGFTGTVF